ncbi:uncharacterized protein LOC131438979 [Malaya genurostris]|uniref:uncharacterized protein LOC131438979 n=1 Tax=Malaya genurostris TaxID=325434 RepID=UPI0026F3E9F4|nr:uncharacterized protein LOC131438979 [Malaya genurostris]XP_058465412.1 uncharacterized protein LOC131438979 [Malaya genurostris]XP_058465413.1 uncharacterized protein LOC131438979 [Malaya genurostris]XP_058465414.1 uncharacterized protein LOC131438979 [Malaya genurostris]XP_058465415.1 uncharacterized protein LOC131438979 [Malaya genurostris]
MAAMSSSSDLEKDAFIGVYELASGAIDETLTDNCRFLEHIRSIYYGYGDSLAKVGRLNNALDVYALISGSLESGLIPLDRMKCLTNSLVASIVAKRSSELGYGFSRTGSDDSVDALCCPICDDVLRYPITAICGHTFCRQCCFGHTQCTVCNQLFPTISGSIVVSPSSRRSTSTLTMGSLAPSTATSSSVMLTDHEKLTAVVASDGAEEGALGGSSSDVSDTGSSDSSNSSCIVGFEQDILIRRLVERWWGPRLKAAEFNDEAQRYLESNALDDALRCCNQSLEQAPTSYKGLLLRSEVLYRLQHYQSALADADNALKSRPTSHKAYYYRALSLSAMDKPEQAILSHCISIFLDKQSMCVASGIMHELAKDLQKLLASSRSESELPSDMMNPLTLIFDKSHSPMNSRKRRHHRTPSAYRHKVKKHYLSLRTSDFDETHSDCTDEDYFRASFFDEMDDFYQQTMKPSHHHRRKLLTAYDLNIFNPRMDEPLVLGRNFYLQKGPRVQQQTQPPAIIIPGPNSKLRSFVDQMAQKLESIRWAEGNPVRLHVNPQNVEVSDFDCVLCCRTLWRPVVTPCGHTYCWVCLDRCMDYSSSCPLCMAPLVEQFRHHLASSAGQFALLTANPTLISLSKRKVTQFVELAMQRFIPDAYEKRQRQELDREPTVPVFICTTAFPSVPCPLFVYEPRYRLMVRRAIESGERQFGIALPQQSGRQRYVEYGTMLDIRDCVQLGDGCSILSTVGARRFRVVARHEKDGYDTANVEFIEDDKIDCEGASKDGRVHLIRELHEKVLLKAIDWHQSLSENIKCEIFKSFGKMPDLEENWEDVVDGPAWAWWIIAILPLSQHLKVDILSTTSLEKRLRAIDKTLNLEESAQQKRKRSVCVVRSSPASPPPVSCCDGLHSSVAAAQHQQQHQNHHNNHHHNHHHQQQQCQAIDCCLRERTTSTDHHHHHHEDDDHHHHHDHHHNHHHDHHPDSDRNSSGDHHHHHHHHHHDHLNQSVEAAEYLL